MPTYRQGPALLNARMYAGPACRNVQRDWSGIGFAAASLICWFVTTSATALPWGNSGPKLDPRDAAFAPAEVVPAETGVQWGVPLQGGPLKVLFIAPRFALRDAEALARRIELRVETVALWDATHLGQPEPSARAVPGTSRDDVIAELRKELDKKWDAIIAANFDFGVLPPEVLQLLTDKIRAGTGIVLAHHRHTLPDALKAFLDEVTPDPAGAIVTHGLGEQLTAEWKSGLGFVQCGNVGNGRLVELDYEGDWPRTHCLIPALDNPLLAEQEDFDTYLSLAARALRWAARRDVPVTVAGVRAKPAPHPEELQIPPGLEEMVNANLPAGTTLYHPYTLDLSAPADRTYRVRTGVRQRGRGQPPVTITLPDPVRKGAQTCDFYVVAGAGEYWLDVWLLDGDKVAEWFSQAIALDGWPSIADLAINKPSVLSQDTIGITFTMPAQKRPCIAMARATDAYGRVVGLHHQPIAPDTSVARMGLGFADLLGDILKVEVWVSDRDLPAMPDWDTRIAAYASKYVPVRGPVPVDRFDVVTSVDGSAEFNAREYYRALTKLGITAVRFPAAEESMRVMPSLGLHAVPEITTYSPYQATPSTVRTPCLNDPEFIRAEQSHLKGMAQIVRDYATAAISFGGANALSASREDLCTCPNCIAGFGEYLRKQYVDLAALNHAWGASYTAWDAIAPLTEQQARESQRYAPWVDFRLYMDSVFLKTHAEARKAMRTGDMRARCGISAFGVTDELFSGYDWAALASELDMLATPADPRLVEIVHSTRGPAALAGIEAPADATPARLRWLPWYAVLHRAQSVWWPDITASTVNVPVPAGADPLGNPVDMAPEFFHESAALEDGLARLWLKSAPARPSIAIYTGRASAWLNEVDNRFGVSSADSERAFAAAFAALGYPFDFVTPQRIEKGTLSGYRVLVLPMARALSDGDVSAIKTFAASGGCVVADIAPGSLNEHGVARETPPLAETFGVKYAKAPTPAGPANALVELTIGGAKASGDFADIRADAAVGPAGAETGGMAGASPVWLLHANSPALLLNHTIAEHTLDRARGILDGLLRSAGVQPVVDVAIANGKEFRGERFAATFGGAQIIALLADAGGPAKTQKVRLRFDRSAHVYDLRTNLPIRRPTTVNVELQPGAAGLLSVLPYDVAGCTLTTPPTAPVGMRMPFRVEIKSDRGSPGDHLVRVDVFAVTTETLEPLPQYAQEILCAKGEGNGFIPFALNDRTTRYRIVARDLLSGASGESFVFLTHETRN